MINRIIGHMVTRNELSRYLRATAPALQRHCDELVVYDDGSTDGTVDYLESIGATVVPRSGTEPFAEHEGHCRAAAWQAMEALAKPRTGDWVLCLDADELLGSGQHTLRDYLAVCPAVSLRLPVDEAFSFDRDGLPLIRTDGFWGQITACRLGRWRPEQRFNPRREGGGSVPSEWMTASQLITSLRILHLGYAKAEDRVEKYMRYRSGTGHNRRHVESILSAPRLRDWEGPLPAGYEAVR